MRLSKRLRCVVDELCSETSVADIGADHGKVLVTALLEGRIKKGIATDISEKSLDKARMLALDFGVPLDTRVGDGLDVIREGEADTLVIAGMGGNEIMRILKRSELAFSKLVLVPHRDSPETRKFIVSHGYKIEKDYKILSEKRYYDIIVARRGDGNLSDIEMLFGKNDMKNDDFSSYIEKRKTFLESIVDFEGKEEERKELKYITEYFYDGKRYN